MTQHLAHLQWHAFIGFSIHDGIIISVPPIPTPRMPHITFDVINGVFLGSQVSTSQTFGMGGLKFMGRTTDAGFIVPHVSIPPNNLLLPLTILLGESLVMLGASGVRIPCENVIWGPSEQDMGACLIPVAPVSMNVACQDWCPAPFDIVVAPNTIMVGITLADFIGALIEFVIAVATAALFKFGGAALSKKATKLKKAGKVKWGKFKVGRASKAAKKASGKAMKEGLSEAGEKAAKEAAEQASQEASEKVMKEGLSEAQKEAAKKAAKEASPDPPPGASKIVRDSYEQVYLKALKEQQEALLKKAAKEAGEEAGEKALKEAQEKLLKEAAKEAGDAAFNEIFKKGGKWAQSLTSAAFFEKMVVFVFVKAPLGKYFWGGEVKRGGLLKDTGIPGMGVKGGERKNDPIMQLFFSDQELQGDSTTTTTDNHWQTSVGLGFIPEGFNSITEAWADALAKSLVP